MTKDNFISLMTAVERKIKERDQFLDKIYEFCNDDFLNQLFDKFDMFQDYLNLIEEEICQTIGLRKENLTENWLCYFIFDCECDFSKIKIWEHNSQILFESWADVWDFYVELTKEE